MKSNIRERVGKMPKEKTKKRNPIIDIAKGIGILSVIVQHICGGGTVTTLMKVFNLPLFFLITGYCFKYESSFKIFINKKIKSYLIPYIGCSVILILFLGIRALVIGDDVLETVLISSLSFLLQRRYSVLWFLSTLLVGVLIFWVTIKLSNTRFLIFSCIIGLLFILYDTYIKISLPWNIDTAFIVQIYLAVGYTMKQNKLIEKLEIHKEANTIICLFICAICTVINYMICHQTYDMFWNSYGIFPLTFFAAITGSLAVVLISYMLKRMKLIEWLGKNTMAFYAFHQSFALVLCTDFLNYIGISTYNLHGILEITTIVFELIVVLIICYLMHIVLIKTKFRFILGK